MGKKYARWNALSHGIPSDFRSLRDLILQHREFRQQPRLDYGDHGIDKVVETILSAIEEEKRIALYADYDVDGTMSCVSWIWFLRELGYENFVHYIPCRFKEGYGVNLAAIKHLIEEERAEVIITMDTGITANEEARYCREHGVTFICTDHHVIQPEKIPDALILNPKLHPDPEYQNLCGCGITFVLLRRLGRYFPMDDNLWNDLLALAGMATICDVVPLNGVNHRLARMGVDALLRSHRPVLEELRRACSLELGLDEKDVGFRLGPRINAVGRLDHAHLVVSAFVDEDPGELVKYMNECNEQRRLIQQRIVEEADSQARQFKDDPILFLGGDWHHGVVGIAASKITEKYWKPTFLFQRKADMCKGSARSIDGFDVTEAMGSAKTLFTKFGGHRAAGGFTFDPKNEDELRTKLVEYASQLREKMPEIWNSKINYDCMLPWNLVDLPLAEMLDGLKPFGHGFNEPRFVIEGRVDSLKYGKDKETGEPRHTFVFVKTGRGVAKLCYFNEVIEDLTPQQETQFLVSLDKQIYKGNQLLSITGCDYVATN